MLNASHSMQKTPRLVAQLLGFKTSKVSTLMAEAQRLSQINIIVRQSLDHQLGEHVRVASAADGLVTLVVDSPVWATRLRYMQSTIIEGLQKYSISADFHQIKFKVRPSGRYDQKKQRRPKCPLSISHSSAERMKEALDTLPDSELKASLTKILRHAK